jgi:hypothetical protein
VDTASRGGWGRLTAYCLAVDKISGREIRATGVIRLYRPSGIPSEESKNAPRYPPKFSIVYPFHPLIQLLQSGLRLVNHATMLPISSIAGTLFKAPGGHVPGAERQCMLYLCS